MINLVIFDMDGLMFDTETLSFKMWHQIFDKYSLKKDDNFFLILRGRNESDCVKLFNQEYQVNIDFRKLKKEKNDLVYDYIIKNGVPIKKGLIKLLDYLKKNNIKIGLATSNKKEIAIKYLKLANVYNYFNYFVFGEDVVASKPDPEIFEKCRLKAQVKQNETLVLEDSKAGVDAALSAGLNVYWIPDGIEFSTKALRLNNLEEVIERI